MSSKSVLPNQNMNELSFVERHQHPSKRCFDEAVSGERKLDVIKRKVFPNQDITGLIAQPLKCFDEAVLVKVNRISSKKVFPDQCIPGLSFDESHQHPSQIRLKVRTAQPLTLNMFIKSIKIQHLATQ